MHIMPNGDKVSDLSKCPTRAYRSLEEMKYFHKNKGKETKKKPGTNSARIALRKLIKSRSVAAAAASSADSARSRLSNAMVEARRGTRSPTLKQPWCAEHDDALDHDG
jgi:hypothetical protein